DHDQDQHFDAPEGHGGDDDGEDVEDAERDIALDVPVGQPDHDHEGQDDGVDDAAAEPEQRIEEAAPDGLVNSRAGVGGAVPGVVHGVGGGGRRKGWTPDALHSSAGGCGSRQQIHGNRGSRRPSLKRRYWRPRQRMVWPKKPAIWRKQQTHEPTTKEAGSSAGRSAVSVSNIPQYGRYSDTALEST